MTPHTPEQERALKEVLAILDAAGFEPVVVMPQAKWLALMDENRELRRREELLRFTLAECAERRFEVEFEH